MSINIEMTPEQLANAVDRGDELETIKAIDDRVASVDFTEMVLTELVKSLRENLTEDELSELVSRVLEKNDGGSQ